LLSGYYKNKEKNSRHKSLLCQRLCPSHKKIENRQVFSGDNLPLDAVYVGIVALAIARAMEAAIRNELDID